MAGFDVRIRAYQERIEFDTKKLLSSLPEAETERKRVRPKALDLNNFVT